MSSLDIFAYRAFGEAFHRREDSFASFRTKLRQASYPITVSQYLASTLLYALLGGLFAAFPGGVLGWRTFSNPVNPLSLFIETFRPGITVEYLEVFAGLSGLLSFFTGFAAIFTLAYLLPFFKADIRKSGIDRSLLPAITYMYALTKGGMPLFAVFRSLSHHTLILGDTAREINFIVRDMDYLGKDILSAIETAKTRTPSENFKEFLEGLIFVSSSGSVREYLNNKTAQYQELAEHANKDFLQKLDVLAEVYVTVLVAGPLFIMTTLIVIHFFRTSSTQLLYMLIYAIIPLSTLLYLVLLDTMGELSLNPDKIPIPSPHLNLRDISEKVSETDEKKLIKHIHLYTKIHRFKKAIFNPFGLMLTEPKYTFLLSVPLGVLYLVYKARFFYISFPHISLKLSPHFAGIGVANMDFITWIDDHLIIFTLIILIPFIIFYELQARKKRQFDDLMPAFLKNLASMNASGIHLSNSLILMADSKLGVLSEELKKVREDISWGTSISMALLRLESRIGTATASKILHTLIRANESTSDLKSVLYITSEQVNSDENMKKERASQMVIYIFTIYVSFTVFLFIVYVLSVYFFPETVAFKESSGGIANTAFDVNEYTMLMFHSSVIQGLCSGLVAGKMGHGSIYLGLKYSASMVIIAYIVFSIFV